MNTAAAFRSTALALARCSNELRNRKCVIKTIENTTKRLITKSTLDSSKIADGGDFKNIKNNKKND